MSSILVQFYSLPEETIPLLETLKQKFHFRMLGVEYFPELKAFEINSFNDLKRYKVEVEEIASVFLGFVEPVVLEKNHNEFVRKNKEFLRFDLGKVTERGLAESVLIGSTENTELFAVWKLVARELKRVTKAGLWAINTEFGGKSFYKNFRYTEGAKRLSAMGTKFLSDGSFVYLMVEEPSEQ